MDYYVQIVHDRRPFDIDDWHTWKNCKNMTEAVQLSAHRFAREAGPQQPLDVKVFVATEETPRREDGRFAWCDGFSVRVIPESIRSNQ